MSSEDLSTDIANQLTRDWLEQWVIGMNLCPFARQPFEANRVRYVVSSASTTETLLEDLEMELQYMELDRSVETTLLSVTELLQDFLDYNDFLDLAETLLFESGREGIFQIASFHPHYQFADTAFGDAENYTNRSPLPVLHILREQSVEQAIAQHPNIEDVPKRNIEAMNQLGSQALAQSLKNITNKK
ncbi:MAG: DUF1415 domain-containing protein [Gammaproteobacteria bacterium HGW-Gammaproteobacteria-14]|nr:MAG: DUF1415 domain-containing protein [Gammaproteobacteria bacterium HGW-Gammaproteobacteria-14]